MSRLRAADGTADPIRPQRRSAHRLPGRRRRSDRPRLRAELDLAGRALLGRAAGRALLPPAGLVLAPDHVRPPRVGDVGPGAERADARGADGRRRRGDGRRRLRAGGGVRAARGRRDGARCSRRRIPSGRRRWCCTRRSRGCRGRPTTTGRCGRGSRGVRAQRWLEGWGDGVAAGRAVADVAGNPRLREWFAQLERLAASPGWRRS